MIRFHTQILPTNLLLSFADAREGVPFSSVTELVLLELAFELIREAGVRVPGALGNAIGIVGGLIIGDAAVSANLVSPIVVMIVALTALGSMVIPDEEFAAAFRLLKYGFLILGGYLGIYGVVLGIYLTVSHLSGLLSFGIPYLVPFVEEQSVRQVMVFFEYLSKPENTGRSMQERNRVSVCERLQTGRGVSHEVCRKQSYITQTVVSSDYTFFSCTTSDLYSGI